MAKKRSVNKVSSGPARLRIEGDWESAVGKALRAEPYAIPDRPKRRKKTAAKKRRK